MRAPNVKALRSFTPPSSPRVVLLTLTVDHITFEAVDNPNGEVTLAVDTHSLTPEQADNLIKQAQALVVRLKAAAVATPTSRPSGWQEL